MLRKLTMCLLVVGLCVQLYPDVSAREHDKAPPVQSSVVPGSIVRAAIQDLRTLVVAPKEWRFEEIVARTEDPTPSMPTLVEEQHPITRKPKFAFSDLVLKTSDKYGMDWRLVASVISVESSFNPRAVSAKGACGLMQVMPSTAALYRIQTDELFDPRRNLEAGVQHLKWLTNRYSGDLEKVVAAYNSGEGAVDKYRGVPPYQPTRNFVRKVMARYQNHLTIFPKPAGTSGSITSFAELRPVGSYR